MDAAKATVADRGPALLHNSGVDPRASRAPSGATSAPEGRPGRLDDHPAARPQPLPRRGERTLEAQAQGGLPRDQAVAQAGRRRRSYRVHEPGLLRQPRLRRRGGRGDVLLDAGEGARPRAGGAHRRAAAGAVASTTRSSTRRRARAPQRGAAGDARQRRHHADQYRSATRRRSCSSSRGRSSRASASRTSSATSASS